MRSPHPVAADSDTAETPGAIVGPLAGIRVLEMGRAVAAPLAAQTLAEWGADVIKIERTGGGDYVRQLGPPYVTSDAGQMRDESSLFSTVNRGKRSLQVDHSLPDGQRVIRDLAAISDVLIENYKVGSLHRYGLDAESLRTVNPALVYCSISGYGQDGPHRDRAAVDTVVQARSGMMSLTGPADSDGQRAGFYAVDILAGQQAAAAILAALVGVKAGGSGVHLDVSLLDVAISAMAHRTQEYLLSGLVPTRAGNESTAVPIGGPIRCQDGIIMVQASTDARFALLCRAIDREDLATRFACREERLAGKAELLRTLEEHFGARTCAQWCELLDEAGLVCAPVLDIEQVLADPQVRHRRLVRHYRHPLGGSVPAVRQPVLIDGVAAPVLPLPPVGGHTEEILRDLLGLNGSAITRMVDSGAIGLGSSREEGR